MKQASTQSLSEARKMSEGVVEERGGGGSGLDECQQHVYDVSDIDFFFPSDARPLEFVV